MVSRPGIEPGTFRLRVIGEVIQLHPLRVKPLI